MNWSTEAALALLIVALYLKDCLLLLRPNEAVLVKGRVWRAGFGLRDWTLAGREPYLANPLLPHQPVFRLQWDVLAAVPVWPGAPAAALASAPHALDNRLDNALETRPCTPGRAPVDASARLAALQRLLPSVWISWLLLLVLLPATVLGRWGVWSTLGVLALLYLNIGVGLLLVWLSRAHFGLTGRRFALFAFECLICPPYAPNMVRRLSWHAPGVAAPAAEDFASAAARLLAPSAWAAACSACRARVQDQCDAEPEGTPRARALQASLQAWRAAPARTAPTEREQGSL
jgi:hypothetical protein